MNPTGFIWVGPVSEVGGYGSISRNFIHALSHLSLPIRILNVGLKENQFSLPEQDFLEPYFHTKVVGSHPVTLINTSPDGFSHYAFKDTKNIGIFCFETDRIPLHWIKPANELSEIWVPSHFNYHTFSKNGIPKDKLRIVPYCVDGETLSKRVASPFIFPEPVRKFKFLFNGSFDYRKGLDLLIQSYCEAFHHDDDVTLIIKTFVPFWNKGKNALEILKSYIPNRPNNPHIIFLTEKLPNEQLLDLYAASDCYVSTERANGWGYPPMEMMAMGKPVIHLNWGGNTEFMTHENSFLYEPEPEWEMVARELQLTRPREYAGHKWVKIDSEKIQEQMRLVYTQPLLREQKAQRAQKDILTSFSYSTIGKKMADIFGI